MTKLILHGAPISTQHAYGQRGKVRFMRKNAKDLKAAYSISAREQYKGEVLEGPLDISIKLYFTDRRVRDWDNWHKISMDALTGIIWKDDSQIKRATVEMLTDKSGGRIEIDVKSYA